MRRAVVFFLIILLTPVFSPVHAQDPVNAAKGEGSSLYLEPSTGKFTVNNTFTISIYVNTNGVPINAIEADLKFPPDKLQVVSPTTNTSFFKVWLGVPSYSNSEGVINLKGGVPSPGIITSKGLISTVTFRAKSTGQAQIVFTDESKVLADDGKATDVLSQKKGATITLVLSPPGGPIVSSPTHPDQTQWYSNNNPIFSWNKDSDVDGFSYILDKEPVTFLDDVVDSVSPRIKMQNVEDGVSFFHIRAHSNDGAWGGVSHYQILVDKTPPAKFPIEIEPDNRTGVHRPIVNFKTTDNASGIDHYELKIIKVDKVSDSKSLMSLFVEANSPYQSSELPFGKYDVIIRAFDKAGNFTESQTNLKIVDFALFFDEGGFGLRGIFFIPLWLFWLEFLALISFLIWLARHFWKKHVDVKRKLSMGIFNFEHRVNEDVRKLKELQKKYAK